MSGRGKGGKGLGAGLPKRRKIDSGDVPLYEWTEGEEAVVLVYASDTDWSFPNCYIVPATRLHKYLALVLHGTRGASKRTPNIEIPLGDTDDDTLFEFVKQTHVDGGEEDEEEDEHWGEEEEDPHEEVEDRDVALEELAAWAAVTLDCWKSTPPTAVKMVGFIKMHKNDD